MSHIYEVYRKTLMNAGPYKAYFTSRMSYGEPRKFSKTEYSREPLHSINSGEREKEQRADTNAGKNVETKNEVNGTEPSQKVEASVKTEPSQKTEQEKKLNENQTELSYEKIGLPYEKIVEVQTDVKTRNRPSPYYDKAESRW